MRLPGSRFFRHGSATGVEWNTGGLVDFLCSKGLILKTWHNGVKHTIVKVQVGESAQERKIRVTLGALPSSYDVGDKAVIGAKCKLSRKIHVHLVDQCYGPR